MPRGLSSSSSASRIRPYPRAPESESNLGAGQVGDIACGLEGRFCKCQPARLEMNAPLFNSDAGFHRNGCRMPVSDAEIERIHPHIARISRPRHLIGQCRPQVLAAQVERRFFFDIQDQQATFYGKALNREIQNRFDRIFLFAFHFRRRDVGGHLSRTNIR